MKHLRTGIIPVLAAALILTLGGLAFAAGSADDPLVSLSYLNQVFAPGVEEKVSLVVADNEEALKASLAEAIDQWNQKLQAEPPSADAGDPASFKVVTLSRGQVLTGEVGCEVMLRIGSAVCVSDSAPGLIDTTSAGTLNNNGALETNHLYMVTIPTRGVRATTDVVKVLARGSYTVK